MFKAAWLTTSILLAQGVLGADEKAKPTQEGLAARSITTAPGKVGDLLRQSWQEKTAAGNAGDFYDNRDGGHSDLDTTPYPQLQRVHYTAEDVKLRRHWALQPRTLPHVVFGNSSTSAPFLYGGSNVRMYYSSARGLGILYDHYTHNNIYIYPEHRDHDPGHNGANDGYGDAYPTNTPYLITSQGSSGSDQPFMRAIPFTLAAFRPEVKKKLIDTGLLMPTLQMILRSSNRHLQKPADYLTGKAHPTVFEGAWVDDLKMVELAHRITLENIPPNVKLKVIEEDQPAPGKDFFDTATSEKLADTPAAIGRIVRGKDYKRRLLVSAGDSYDVNKRPLRFHWVVLRGDPDRIRIRTLNPEQTQAEISVAYHERRPIAPGSSMESNRVDIGVFVNNGVHYSAPAFVTLFSLDHEARTYDKHGRIVEIGYGMGETILKVQDWSGLLQLAGAEGLPARLLHLSTVERSAVKEAAQYEKLALAVKQAAEQRRLLDKRRAQQKGAKLDSEIQRADKALNDARRAADAFLDRPFPSAKKSLRALVAGALKQALGTPRFTNDHAGELTGLLATAETARKNAVTAGLQRLVALGVALKPAIPLELKPLRANGWTTYEKALLENFNAAVLCNLVLPGVASESYVVNYVDPRLSAPRTWRDLYHYDDAGHYLGWIRYAPEGKSEFSPDGLLILEKDSLGRCLKGRTVRYVQEAASARGPNWNPLRQVAGDEIIKRRP